MRRLALCIVALSAPAAAQLANIIDGSGAIATASAPQPVFQPNVNRSYLECQNPVSATEPLFLNIGAAASTTGGSFELTAGGSIRFSIGNTPVPLGIVSVAAATAGHRFVCKQG